MKDERVKTSDVAKALNAPPRTSIMKDERLKTSDIAKALNAPPRTIAKIASRERIRGEREGLGRGKQTKYTLEQAEAIAKAHRSGEGVSRLQDWMKMQRTTMQPEKERTSEGKKEEEKKPAEKAKVSPVQQALTDSYSRTVKRMTEETDWWIDAVTKIGHSTILIAFQEAKVPPEELYEEVKKFKNADEFIARVEEYMAALYEAKKDASSLIEEKKKSEKYYYRMVYVIEVAKELGKRLKKLEKMYNWAVSNLDEEGMRRFAVGTPLVLSDSADEEDLKKEAGSMAL